MVMRGFGELRCIVVMRMTPGGGGDLNFLTLGPGKKDPKNI
jgi:hypothetical protein